MRIDTQPGVLNKMSEEQLIDINILRELVGDDQEVINDILQEFLASAGKIATELNDAYKATQYDQVCITAHKLKSSARYIGALRLGKLCEQIEHCGEKGGDAQLNELLPRFKAEMAAVESYLAERENITL